MITLKHSSFSFAECPYEDLNPGLKLFASPFITNSILHKTTHRKLVFCPAELQGL